MRRTWAGLSCAAVLAAWTGSAGAAGHDEVRSFERVAHYDVVGEVAEIVAATPDGRTLVYSDSEEEHVGFVDIADPSSPQAAGTVDTDGEPTSVAVTGDGLVLVVVNGDEGDGQPDHLLVVDAASRTEVRRLALPGQPDSVALSPNGRYAAIAIENERDEDRDDGAMPQEPAGGLAVVKVNGNPVAWQVRTVDLTGLADRFPSDPEPEFIDVNADDIAAVTLQENNHVVLVNLRNAKVVDDWSAGESTHAADLEEDGDIAFADTLTARREPDAIAWTPAGNLVTANEGDYDVVDTAGSRDFTVFSAGGKVVYEPGAALEQEAARWGFYPDDRSENKGIEPEGAEVGVFGGTPFAFVGAERGNVVAVYDLSDEGAPVLVQLLPTGDRPEGLLAIPDRGLFVVANEGDGTLDIFASTASRPPAPSGVVSATAAVEGWGALSGMVAHPSDPGLAYAVPDDVFAPSRIWTLDVTAYPARIVAETEVAGSYDLEGVADRGDGGWWVVSEGDPRDGTANLLVSVDPGGAVAQEVALPADVAAKATSNGFEGVTVLPDGRVAVAFQRAWTGESHPRIGLYDPVAGTWAFLFYELEPRPANAGWVGLSEITSVGDDRVVVVERDNAADGDATIKRLYEVSLAQPDGLVQRAEKRLVADLVERFGLRLEKVEGVAAMADRFLVATDNDGAGETALLAIGD